MTDSKSRCVVKISTDTRPIVYLTIDRLSTDYRPTIGQPSTDYRPTIDRLSTDCRPTIDRLSTDCRPLYRPLCRPLCRPISQSTLPTVRSSSCHSNLDPRILRQFYWCYSQAGSVLGLQNKCMNLLAEFFNCL